MGTLRSYRLALASLPEGVSEHDYVLDTAFFEAMEQSEVVGADVKVHLEVDHKNGAYYLHIGAEGELSIPCDRCLEPMGHPVNLEENLTVKYGAEYDDSADGVLVIPETDASLDLAPLLYDMMLLSIPMRHVHPEGSCDPSMSRILEEHASSARVEGEEYDDDELPAPADE